MLEVNTGDEIGLETWVRFKHKTTYTRDFDLLALSALLGHTLAGAPGFDGVDPTQVATNLNGGLGSFGFGSDDTDDTRPYAYLNYVLFRDDYTVVDAGWRRVPPEGGFDPGEEGLPGMHQRLAFDDPVVAGENGYLYVWVSNESENTQVWFDDLRVSHTGTFVAQATDYGAWGDVLREQRTDERKYRYGYQGQFAERDEETGWNHFELREYDAVVGRWMVVDPARQFWSPYTGMGNNPIKGVDSDGAFTIYKNATTGEEVEVHDGIDRTLVVSDFDFLEAKFFANEIGFFGTTSTVGIADAYKEFYTRVNYYSEFTISNFYDYYFGGPKVEDFRVAGGSGAIELIGSGPTRALGLLRVATKWQNHHKIPKAVFTKFNAHLTPLMKRDGWRNLVNLHAPFHGNHPQYNLYVEKKVQHLINTGNLNRDTLNALIQHLHVEIRSAINSGQKLNDYFRALN